VSGESGALSLREEYEDSALGICTQGWGECAVEGDGYFIQKTVEKILRSRRANTNGGGGRKLNQKHMRTNTFLLRVGKSAVCGGGLLNRGR